METGTVSILTSMRSNAAFAAGHEPTIRAVRPFRGGRLIMHQRPRPPRGHGDLPRTVGPARSVTGREQRSAPGRYEVRQNAEYLLYRAALPVLGANTDRSIMRVHADRGAAGCLR